MVHHPPGGSTSIAWLTNATASAGLPAMDISHARAASRYAASGSSWMAFALASSAASHRPMYISAPERRVQVSGAPRFRFTARLVTSSIRRMRRSRSIFESTSSCPSSVKKIQVSAGTRSGSRRKASSRPVAAVHRPPERSEPVSRGPTRRYGPYSRSSSAGRSQALPLSRHRTESVARTGHE